LSNLTARFNKPGGFFEARKRADYLRSETARRQVGPAVQSSPGSGVTLTLFMIPRCIVGSKYRIACSLRSMMRPGLRGPTSFILTKAAMKVAEAQRTELIGMIDLRSVGSRNGLQAIDS
jgi:hypothetical protein